MAKELLKNFIPILILATLPSFASASGIQASPAKMDFKVESGQAASRELVVANPTADVQLFQVYPDEFANLISANPSSFTLEAGTRKIVQITLKADNSSGSQNLNTNLSVVAKPLANAQFSANTGIKIPIAITVVPASSKPINIKNYWPLPVVVLLLALVLARKKKPMA